MIPVRDVQKKYCSRAMILAIVVGGVFFLIGRTEFMKGLILGTLFSIVNFVLMGESLPHRLNKSRSKVFIVVLGSIALRYTLLAVPLILALKFEQYHFIAAVIGVFMIQIVIFIEHIGGTFLQTLKTPEI